MNDKFSENTSMFCHNFFPYFKLVRCYCNCHCHFLVIRKDYKRSMFITMELWFLMLNLMKLVVSTFAITSIKLLRKKKQQKVVSILRTHPTEEVIAYCSSFQKKICKLCCQFESLCDSFFCGSKKNLNSVLFRS